LRKVGGVPGKANIAEQDAFKKKQLEPRLKEAEEGKREVYFVDAAHFVLAPFFGMLWCLARIFIRTPAGRNRLNVLGALNAISKKLVTITIGRPKRPSTVDRFLAPDWGERHKYAPYSQVSKGSLVSQTLLE
jgi:hypothetical protein